MHRFRTVLSILPLLAAAWLLAAGPAVAQPGSVVTVYHSLDPAGDDPRPEAPPGCMEVAPAAQGGLEVQAAAAESSNVLIFSDTLLNFVNVNLQTDLQNLGNTVSLVTGASLPADISVFDVIWIVKSSPISAADQTALIDFVVAGGGLHLGGELPSFDNVNDTIEVIANALVVGGAINVGRQGGVAGPFVFNPAVVGGIATTPNTLTQWSPLSPGEVSATAGLDADNILVTGAESRHVGAAWDSAELVGGVGRLTLLMDWNWLDNESPTPRLPVIENIQHFLAGASGTGGPSPSFDCVLQGGSGEALELWIDGGPNPSGAGEMRCNLGLQGGSGDEVCGAALLFEITGPGVFTDFFPDTSEGATIQTVVHNPACTAEEGCDLAGAPVKQFRMNFVRGASAPPTGPRKLGTLVVNSTGSTNEIPTVVEVSGVAAGASLQERTIPPTGQRELVASTNQLVIPEPGAMLQIVSGLFGLGMIQRWRRRRV